MAAAVEDAREISRIAYGFQASKALFTAIELGIFERLSDSPQTLPALADDMNLAPNRLETLLTALTSLGLLSKDTDAYANAPGSNDYLVPGRPRYFGDYFRLQTDRFIYPAFNDLTSLIRGDGGSEVWGEYEEFMRDPARAETFSHGQHAGSLGPAAALAKHIDLSSRKHLLDVGGGSGAFTIMLCRRNPELRATILDFPNALRVGRSFVDEAGLGDRVAYREADATAGEWPQGHDVVLMSYLLSAVSAGAIEDLLGRAYISLPAGGMVVVHDFMVDDDQTGPPDAALPFLGCMFNAPDAIVLTPQRINQRLGAAGFADVRIEALIPDLTRFAVAFKQV
ncbi:MAG: methyltransferase [Acidobacteria bacterium]|nr:methyltransferase [Acidobacteriota bacterium]